jgi:DNA adenine methylase
MKTPISYYGGKQAMLSYILPVIPPHEIYVEPFFGGGAVFFAKHPAKLEIINDLNNIAITFYKQLKNNFSELERMISVTLHSRTEKRRAWLIYNNPEKYTDVELAWAFWVETNMSYANKIGAGLRYATSQHSFPPHTTDNKRKNFTERLAKRLERTEIECMDALRVIKSRDRRQTFFYIDTPYFNADQGHYKGYSIENFTQLLDILENLKGRFLLSNYNSEILTEYTVKNKWYKIEVKKPLMNRKGKTTEEKTEVLVANYNINHIGSEHLFSHMIDSFNL